MRRVSVIFLSIRGLPLGAVQKRTLRQCRLSGLNPGSLMAAEDDALRTQQASSMRNGCEQAVLRPDKLPCAGCEALAAILLCLRRRKCCKSLSRRIHKVTSLMLSSTLGVQAPSGTRVAASRHPCVCVCVGGSVNKFLVDDKGSKLWSRYLWTRSFF